MVAFLNQWQCSSKSSATGLRKHGANLSVDLASICLDYQYLKMALLGQ